MKNFSIILAVDNENWIWVKWDLAWQIPEDMKYFKKITSKTKNSQKQNAVIMGRKTWESIPNKYRPFSGRYNCVLSRSYTNGSKNSEWAFQFNSLDVCLKHLDTNKNIESIFVIWGAQIFNQVLTDKRLKRAYITRIYQKYHCDTFFDGLPLEFNLESRSEMMEHNGIEFEFSVHTYKISLLKRIKNIFRK
jgi:dihydrofolate reductase